MRKFLRTLGKVVGCVAIVVAVAWGALLTLIILSGEFEDEFDDFTDPSDYE